MSVCHNKNTVEYKALKEVFGTDIITNNIINSYQEFTKTDATPTVVEANELIAKRKAAYNLKQNNFSQALLNNLRRLNIIHSFQGTYYINNTDKDTLQPSETLINGNVKRLYNYLDINNLSAESIELDKTKKTFAVKIKPNLFTTKDMLESSRSWDKPRSRKVASHLLRMFPGLNIELLSIKEAKEKYEAIPKWQKAKVPFDKINSFYSAGTAYLIKGRVTDETAIEEMLHPFIDAVKVDNISLFEGLLAEAKKNFPEMTQQITDAYNSDRRVTAEELEMEIVTQALSRHFKKEYESTPTQTFLNKIKQLADWFFEIINNLNEVITGRALKVDNINANASLTDIAKLLNTDGISFKLTRAVNGRVRYSLSTDKQKQVDKAKSVSQSDIQKNMIDRLFHNITESKLESDTLSAGINIGDVNSNDIVIRNKEDGRFYNLSDKRPYLSSNQVLGIVEQSSLKDTKQDLETMLDAIASFKTFEEISDTILNVDKESAKVAFKDLFDSVDTIMDQGDVLLTNVVFHDTDTMTASKADIVIISKGGSLKLSQIQLFDSKIADGKKIKLSDGSLAKALLNEDSLSMDLLNNLQVNMLRRMAENMGYKVQYGPSAVTSLRFSYENNKVNYDNPINHPASQNDDIVDKLIPVKESDFIKQEIEDQVFKDANEAIYDNDIDLQTTEQLASEVDPLDYPEQSAIQNSLENYRVGLIEKQKALQMIKSNIFMDRSKDDTKESIANTLSYITIARSQGPVAMSVAYTKILREALTEMKGFTNYVADPKNYQNKEFIGYVMNFDRFLATFEGLHNLDNNKELNATQRSLLGSINIELTKLLGVKKAQSNGSRDGLVNRAILDYVAEVIKANTSTSYDEGDKTMIQSHSGKDYTVADLDALLEFVPDISGSELFLSDLSTSKDAILATMDKIFKAKKQEWRKRVQVREEVIRTAGQTLLELSPVKDLEKLYDFMLEFNDAGDFTGLYTQKIGKQYYTKKEEIRSKLYDSTGKPFEYFPIYSLENADPNQVKYNKQLYLNKKAFGDFMKAERVVDGNLANGQYHKYTQEFLDIRSKFEYFQLFSDNTGGRWIKKAGVPQASYDLFRDKYYQNQPYTKAFKSKGGEPTGAIKENENFPDSVRPEFTEVLESVTTNSSGELLPINLQQNMLNEKYIAIMNPTDALGQAKKNFYDLFIKYYQTELLEKLPMGTKNQMVGKVPLVKNNFVNEIQARPTYFIKMIPRFLRSIKNLFVQTAEQKLILTDEVGNLVDTLPVFYTGVPAIDGQLEQVQNQKEQLIAKRNRGDIKLEEYEKQRKELEAQIVTLRSKPTTGEISKDMATSLIKFSQMAENFEVMGQIEDTLQAMVKAIEMRTYAPGGKTTFISKQVDSVKGYLNKEVGKKNLQGLQSKAAARAHHWLKMVYYDNSTVTKGPVEKLTNGIVNLSSLSYVAFNVFGNFNNAAMGQINNWIEGIGGLYFDPKAYARAEWEFTTMAVPGLVKRTAYIAEEMADFAGRIATLNTLKIKGQNYNVNKPNNLYEWRAEFFDMMDDDNALRETSGSNEGKTLWSRFVNFGYSFNQGAEYMVQTKIGTAILHDVRIKKKGEQGTLSLGDAYEFNAETNTGVLKPGYDTIVSKEGVETPYNDAFRDQLRNLIREVNKQTHGNYNRYDRMVIQNNFGGVLLAQFHKWVMPAVKARFQPMYYDQNIGWLEGRYVSLMKFTNFITATAKENLRTSKTLGLKDIGKRFRESQGFTGEGGFNDQKANMMLRNLYRTTAEAMLIVIIMALNSLMEGADDDDDMIMRRLKNFGAYQASRLEQEMILFVPIFGSTEVYQMFKTPVASTRTLGEFGEALEMSFWYPFGALTKSKEEFNADSYYVYQNRPRKGQLKLTKNWADILPLIYTLQKWRNFDKMDDFYIK